MQFLLKSQLILSFRVPFRNQMSRKYKRHSSTFFIMSVMKLKFKILKTAPQKKLIPPPSFRIYFPSGSALPATIHNRHSAISVCRIPGGEQRRHRVVDSFSVSTLRS